MVRECSLYYPGIQVSEVGWAEGLGRAFSIAGNHAAWDQIQISRLEHVVLCFCFLPKTSELFSVRLASYRILSVDGSFQGSSLGPRFHGLKLCMSS